jgi:hypothetical protein
VLLSPSLRWRTEIISYAFHFMKKESVRLAIKGHSDNSLLIRVEKCAERSERKTERSFQEQTVHSKRQKAAPRENVRF